MTVIVAHKCSEGVFIGCDSQITFGESRQLILPDPKWHRYPKFYILRCGLGLIKTPLEKLEGSKEFCKLNPAKAGDMYKLVAFLKETLGEEGVMSASEDGPDSIEGSLIIACKSRILFLDPCLSIYEQPSFIAMGSGADFAYGAFHALEGKVKGEELVRKTLMAATRYSPYCAEPLYITKYTDAS